MSTWHVPLSNHWHACKSSLWVWWRRAKTRNALSSLDARLLSDIGRSEAECRRECSKWFWQV